MITRYSRLAMRELWSEANKYETWLKVEIAIAKAYSKINPQITPKDLKNLEKNAQIDVARIESLEKETKHDVIAFTRQVSETLGPEKKWLHYGITSTDVVDTAQSYRLKQVNTMLKDGLELLTQTIKTQAIKHQWTYQMGRTHGIHAELTTWGYKLALWYDEMQRQISRFALACEQIEVAKISGAVGNYAHIPPSIQEDVSKELGLSSSLISSQTLQRDRHAHYIFTISLIGTSLEKFATEIRNLQRTEVGEVYEFFEQTQKGSSAMPHKKNPIISEQICGLARVLRGFVLTSLEDVTLWHERDISHSSAERIILPDATTMLDYMLDKFNSLLKNLVVDKEQMLKNIDLTQRRFFSQKVMLALIDKKGLSREDAYDKVQVLVNKAWQTKHDFEQVVREALSFSEKEYQAMFDFKSYLKNIEVVFKRLKLTD